MSRFLPSRANDRSVAPRPESDLFRVALRTLPRSPVRRDRDQERLLRTDRVQPKAAAVLGSAGGLSSFRLAELHPDERRHH